MLEYVSDVPRGDPAALEAETAHVRAYLSAVAAEDDDPSTNADDVAISVIDHPMYPLMVRIVGTLDAEPNAPYLRDDYDPYANVDPELFAAEVANAVADEEALRG